jgi:hypothetical protein
MTDRDNDGAKTPMTEPMTDRDNDRGTSMVARCPNCGSLDLQFDQGVVECDHCPWTGQKDQTDVRCLRDDAAA